MTVWRRWCHKHYVSVVVGVVTIFARFRQQNAVVRVGLALLALPPLDALAAVRCDEVCARSCDDMMLCEAVVLAMLSRCVSCFRGAFMLQ
jgi:hypothetical protein